MTDSNFQPPMSRRAAREFERRQGSHGTSAPPSAQFEQQEFAERLAAEAAVADQAASAIEAPASAVYAPDGRLLTRREVRAMREALEAGTAPEPLVEPDDAPTRPRSSIAAPVPLPDAPTAHTAPALPPEAAGATSVPVERPSAGGSAASAGSANAAPVSSGVATSVVDGDAAVTPLVRRLRGRRSAISAHSAQTAASAPVEHAAVADAAAESAAVGSAAVPSAAVQSGVVESAPVASAAVGSVPAATEQEAAAAVAEASAPGSAEGSAPSAPAVVSSTPLSQTARTDASVAVEEPLVTSTPFSLSAEADEPGAEERASRYAEFDSLLAPDGSGSTISTNALVLPSVPGHEDLPRALDGTGEILVTGTFNLPSSLSETGAHHPVLDGLEVDRLIDADERQPIAPGSGPVRASRAVSTHTATRGIIQPKRPKTNRLLTALAITASVLAAGVVALLVIGVLNGVFF